MVHHSLYRKRFVRRHRLRLRHAALAGVIACALYAGAGLVVGDATDAGLPAAQVAALPATLDENQTQAAVTVPFGEDNYTKPVTQTPVAASSLSAHLSSIESGISAILDSGERRVAEKKVVIGKGDTLMGLLVNKAEVPRAEAYQAVQALSKIYNPRDIVPGREITVFFHKDPAATPAFSGVKIERDIVNTVTVKRDDKGEYKADNIEKAVHATTNAFGGTISNSLYVDARAAGVPDAVILDMIKMYSWNVDFQREIRSGDRFEVMYEEFKTDDGKVVPGRGNIAYAKLTLSGTEMPFYRYKDSKGEIDYYDASGRSAKKPLMKTPIDGARISSGFGVRKHPVLGFTKMHKGVDFAAATGTPIYAAGDGTIARIGPFSSYGNYVRIRHRSGLETAYAHMSRFKSGLKAGSRVKQGDIIGYVGTTGRSTGPHLHYEVLVNNAQVNPNSVKLPTGRALKGNDLKNFQSAVSVAQAQFDSIGKIVPAVAESAADKKNDSKLARN